MSALTASAHLSASRASCCMNASYALSLSPISLTASASAFASAPSFALNAAERRLFMRPRLTDAATPTLRALFFFAFAASPPPPPFCGVLITAAFASTSRTTSRLLLPSFTPRATSSMRACASIKFALSGCESGVSAMIACSSSGYFVRRCTGLMRRDGRSHAPEYAWASACVCARYALNAGVRGRLL